MNSNNDRGDRGSPLEVVGLRAHSSSSSSNNNNNKSMFNDEPELPSASVSTPAALHIKGGGLRVGSSSSGSSSSGSGSSNSQSKYVLDPYAFQGRDGRTVVDIEAAAERAKLEELLDRMILNSGEISARLSNRLLTIRTLRQMWEREDVSGAIDLLSHLTDAAKHDPTQLVAFADFLWAIDLRRSGGGLTLETCTRLMPLLDFALSTKFGWASEHVVKASLKSMIILCDAFGVLIEETRKSAGFGGGGGRVDLTREERVQRCLTCHAVMMRVKGYLEQLRQQHRSSKSVTHIVNQLQDLLA